MLKPISTLLLPLLLGAGGAMAQLPLDSVDVAESQQQLQSATWPSDIVRQADRYLHQHPGATDVADVRARAASTSQLLNNGGVQLQRSAFLSRNVPDERQGDLRQAALGDADAAMRMANLYRPVTTASATEAHRYVGWLQLAAGLGSQTASYELALHYRRDGQPAMAAIYESRALALGFVAPPSLDHVRK